MEEPLEPASEEVEALARFAKHRGKAPFNVCTNMYCVVMEITDILEFVPTIFQAFLVDYKIVSHHGCTSLKVKSKMYKI